jgi:Bacteriocin-protection, YdeI or OmpD-Associated/Domain of unknown function (DUF1905)
MTSDVRFTVTLEGRPRGGVRIRLPFDPNASWGEKDRHYVAGTAERYGLRGVVTQDDDGYAVELGPAWCRDPRVGAGATVDVVLRPEGPQLDTMGPDLAAALEANPSARRFFESLATFYRKGFVRWVDDARRPETRAKRIGDTVAALEAGLREHR